MEHLEHKLQLKKQIGLESFQANNKDVETKPNLRKKNPIPTFTQPVKKTVSFLKAQCLVQL